MKNLILIFVSTFLFFNLFNNIQCRKRHKWAQEYCDGVNLDYYKKSFIKIFLAQACHAYTDYTGLDDYDTFILKLKKDMDSNDVLRRGIYIEF